MDLEVDRSKLIECLRQKISDNRVLAAMADVPRELFVSSDCYGSAYEDKPLSIGFGQTISQPLIVAMMTQALKLKGDEKTGADIVKRSLEAPVRQLAENAGLEGSV